jgi:hypothetical protein
MPINNRWSKISRSKSIYLPTVDEYKIVNNNSKICSLGSCFADRITYELAKKKIDIGEINLAESDKNNKHLTFPWGSFFNPLNFIQIINHILEIKKIDFNEETFIKVPVDLKGNNFDTSTQQKMDEKFKLMNLHAKIKHNYSDYQNSQKKVSENLNKLKVCLLGCDTVIITLGLIETWIDKKSDVAWHSFHGNALEKKSIGDKAYFKQLTYEEVSDCIKQLVDTIVGSLKKKIIFTISPVPMAFTFTNKDVILANRYSKSLLRTSIEKYIDNENTFYFPSFEVVVDSIGIENSFKDDKVHVRDPIFDNYIGPLFFKSFFEVQ